MTRNAVRVQWNDLFTVNDHPTMYRQYRSMFERMVPDVMAQGPFVFPATGPLPVDLLPVPVGDPEHRHDRRRRCAPSAATAPPAARGSSGRTVVYVEMHAWFGNRGRAITRQLQGLYRRGLLRPDPLQLHAGDGPTTS